MFEYKKKLAYYYYLLLLGNEINKVMMDCETLVMTDLPNYSLYFQSQAMPYTLSMSAAVFCK